MDSRAAKLALARKKLKDHQGKKVTTTQKTDLSIIASEEIQYDAGQTIINNYAEKSAHDESSAHAKNELGNQNVYDGNEDTKRDINVTEILISNKRNLELQIAELQVKFEQLEKEHIQTMQSLNLSEKQIHRLETELKAHYDNNMSVKKELQEKENLINELSDIKMSYLEHNNHMTEQLEVTKTMLTAKENENASLVSKLNQVENQLDGMKLQLQQLTNGSSIKVSQNGNDISEVNEVLLQKISLFEQQLKSSQKERDQINIHYEHYVAELNEQLKLVMKQNEEMSREIQALSSRESSLVEQISDMEIRLQNFSEMKRYVEVDSNKTVHDIELEQNYKNIQERFQQLLVQYEEIKQKYFASEARVKELSEIKESENKQDDISLSKLQADMTSDKIAAQRATEQNKKLKKDMQELEEAYVKMTKDKLELTEKIAAEKFLNRELTIKLADIEEKAKDMNIKIMAKDEEMIRLQNNFRSTEKQLEQLTKEIKEKEFKKNEERQENLMVERQDSDMQTEINNRENKHILFENEKKLSDANSENESLIIKNDEAMSKLQERFLKIMGEVADLSDEKHRLEHIILQLQNETDTICEYVALYQQQRSLLKKRDEERNTQIKIFQEACRKLQNQIKELSNLLVRFAEDQELSKYFLNESRKSDLEKVMYLISNLQSNYLIDPNLINTDLKNFYPCSCCSGKLIEV
ncbi:golgin subfamily A member 2 [Amyelois transitella]|uniref:golgin subfamily A member 2 n=1 Tax=Amyelois transitella TaxID=680683 RepID=UPI00299081D5|nr:golgin subfamily A member 2 [Amyelois transitella]